VAARHAAICYLDDKPLVLPVHVKDKTTVSRVSDELLAGGTLISDPEMKNPPGILPETVEALAITEACFIGFGIDLGTDRM